MQLCGAISRLRDSEIDDLLHLLSKCERWRAGAVAIASYTEVKAITPAAPPPKLGGFGEGPQADVRNNTAYPRTEPLPPLGGFGEGPQPQIPSHTGHTPTVSGIPEQLEGFGAGPRADVSQVYIQVNRDKISNIAIVNEQTGQQIIVTAIKNLQPKELRRLGENNGFNPNP